MLVSGLYLIFIPYEKFKVIFPKVKSLVTIRVVGAIVVLCGIQILVEMLLG